MLKSQNEKVSYIIGLDIGRNLAGQGIEVEVQSLALGIADAIGDVDSKLTESEMQAVMTAHYFESSPAGAIRPTLHLYRRRDS